MACLLRTLLIHMDSQGMARGRSRCCRYRRLRDDDEDVEKKAAAAAARPRRRRWARRSSNGAKVLLGFRVSSSSSSKKKKKKRRRLTWRGLFSLLLLTRRLWRHMCAEVLAGGIMALEGVHPTVVFSSQWGLMPVLSHSSININTATSAHRRNSTTAATAAA